MRILAIFGFAVVLAACGSKSESAGADGKGSGSAKPGGSAAAKAGGDDKGGGDEAEEKKLDKIGLSAKLPAMSQVSDAIGGDGIMIMGTAPVTIKEAKDDTPKTVEAAKKDAEMFTPENFKEEKLDDGWVLTFTNKGSMGTNYWMKSIRKIGDKEYACDTSVSNEDQLKAAIEVCKSLKK